MTGFRYRLLLRIRVSEFWFVLVSSNSENLTIHYHCILKSDICRAQRFNRRSKFFGVFASVTVKRGQLRMASSSIITPEDVLESLMNDGTIDALRLKIINQLKANEELKSTTIKMAEQSKVLNTPGAEKQTKRELFDALRQELEASVFEKASKSVWDLILDNNGLGKEISETVERVFCRLSGQEPPLFPLPNGQPQPDKETDNRKEKGKGKQKENENTNSNTPSKKRSFSEINLDGEDETATRSSDPAAALEGSGKSPLSISKT